MAQPKKQTTKSKGLIRRNTKPLKVANLVECPNCGQKINSHQVCPFCGYYKGKKIIEK